MSGRSVFVLTLNNLPAVESPSARARLVVEALRRASIEIDSRLENAGSVVFPPDQFGGELRVIGRWQFVPAGEA
jgi:hypothetical protein